MTDLLTQKNDFYFRFFITNHNGYSFQILTNQMARLSDTINTTSR